MFNKAYKVLAPPHTKQHVIFSMQAHQHYKAQFFHYTPTCKYIKTHHDQKGRQKSVPEILFFSLHLMSKAWPFCQSLINLMTFQISQSLSFCSSFPHINIYSCEIIRIYCVNNSFHNLKYMTWLSQATSLSFSNTLVKENVIVILE